MSLFRNEPFVSHSGVMLGWKIDCDALTDEDIACLGKLAAEIIGPYHEVRGIPRGGLRLAKELERYRTTEISPIPHRPHLLLVDDVFTTGGSMWEAYGEAQAQGYDDISGIVIFARGILVPWCKAILCVHEEVGGWQARTWGEDR